MLSFGLSIAVFASLFAGIHSENGVEFLFPTQGTTLHYNDYVQVQYTSSFSAPWLFTWCMDGDRNIHRE